MELALQQKLVAQLASDRAFRETFFADPARVAASEGLTGEALSQSHCEQLRQFARVLQHRRLAQVGELLPLTHKALGTRFADLFHNYAITPPSGTRPCEDALGFVRHLKQHAATEGLEPAWSLSLATRRRKSRPHGWTSGSSSAACRTRSGSSPPCSPLATCQRVPTAAFPSPCGGAPPPAAA